MFNALKHDLHSFHFALPSGCSNEDDHNPSVVIVFHNCPMCGTSSHKYLRKSSEVLSRQDAQLAEEILGTQARLDHNKEL